MNKIYEVGFRLVSKLETSGLRWYATSGSVAMEKGDAIVITSGVCALGTNDLGATFVGIAYTTNTAAQSAAFVKMGIIPPLQHYQFKVKVESTDLITAAQIGVAYDIASEVGIAEADETQTVWGFFVDEIDVSAEAIDANTYGYAVGHFVHVS